MEISSSNLSSQISLVDADELKPHEEVVDSIVKTLANEMRSEGQVRDPLIVDRENYVILDGMHRFTSLKLLKCGSVPCCLVDYDSNHIKVGSWFRLFSVRAAGSLAEELLNENRLDYSKQNIKLEDMSYNIHAIILTDNGTQFTLPNSLDPIEKANTAALLERAMVSRGHAVEYLSEIVAIEHLKSRVVNFLIQVPIFSKKQIREFGLNQRLLPHKVTRHVIPSRPLRINVPLELLQDPSISQVEANRKLGELLAAKKIERKPPGSIVDGRRYEEELLVFST